MLRTEKPPLAKHPKCPKDFDDVHEEHDGLILELIKQWHWHWSWEVLEAIVLITPEETINELKNIPAWYNRIINHATARAKEQGFLEFIREPEWKTCPLCQKLFIENSLPHPLTKRLGGMENINFCSPCLRDILLCSGNERVTKEEIIKYIRELTEILQQIPPQNFGNETNTLQEFDPKEWENILILLKNKPTPKRVKELFGSWLQALIDAGVLEDDLRRTSRGIQCIAKDGHICLSLGEKTIDDFMFKNEIPHEKEPQYPEGKYRADFVVSGVFIEYFGLVGDPIYDKKIKIKQQMCKRYDIKLISIYPSDLVSINKLKKKLLRGLSLMD